MNVFITHDGKGVIHSLNQTIDGLAHFILGHEDKPSIEGFDAFSDTNLKQAFKASPKIKISFPDGDVFIVEKHALLV